MIKKETILALIQEKGPVLPVEVSSALQTDSFMANAYLSDLVNEGKLKKSSERVGTSFIYFLQGQELAANKKMDELKTVKKTIRTFVSKDQEETPEITQKREQFAKHFEKALREDPAPPEKPQIIKYEPPKPAVQEVVQRYERPLEIRTYDKPIEPVKKYEPTIAPRAMPQYQIPGVATPKPTVNYIDFAINHIKSIGAEITDELIRKKGEASLVVKIPSKLSDLKYFIKVKDKKRLNEADLSLAYTEGLNLKMPTLFITNGALAKTAESYAVGLSGLLTMKFLKP